MLYHIDPSNGLAIYEQIARQVKFAVAQGALRTGDLVPSVRELAQTLAVNPNTVARAYRELEQRGLVDTRGRHGTYVSDPVDRRVRHRRELTEQAAAYARNARAFGIRPEVAIDLVEQALREGAIRSES